MRHLLGFLVVSLLALSASAHPIPQRLYDRTIAVHLSASTVRVDYRVEVDSHTVLFDLADLIDKEAIAKITTKEAVYTEFQKVIAPLFAYNLDVKIDGKALKLKLKEQRYEQTDHVRFDFRYEAEWKPGTESLHHLQFRDNTYLLEEKGWIRLSFSHDKSIVIEKSTVPEESLRTKPVTDFLPGEEPRARTIDVTFRLAETASNPKPPEKLPPSTTEKSNHSLFDLLLDGRLDLWVLAVAFIIGAGHALTPGHGKTLVAAYLVGEKGTVGHALLLGLVTTIAHTGAVLLVAAVLPLIFPDIAPGTTQFILELSAGLLVLCLGLWLLIRRVSGKADHVHFGGGHHHHHHHGDGGHHHHHHHGDGEHHHHHGDGEHHHHDHDHDHDHDHHHHHDFKEGEPVRMSSLIALGISGGIVPCPEAIFLLAGAVRTQRLGLALPLLLAFSAGLAMVLVAIGIGVVYSKRMTSGILQNHGWAKKISRILPILSAIIISILGLWMLSASLRR